LAHFHPAAPLTTEETAAIDDLKDMLRQIADVKEKHKRKAMRSGAHVILPVSSAPEPVETPLPSIPVPAEPTPRPAARSSASASSRRAARKTTPRA
jgi:hypothetical protein